MTYSAEAALCLAELHSDVLAQLLAAKAAREEQERADGKDGPTGEEVGALVPAGEGAAVGGGRRRKRARRRSSPPLFPSLPASLSLTHTLSLSHTQG